jgi:hypothetical protein
MEKGEYNIFQYVHLSSQNDSFEEKKLMNGFNAECGVGQMVGTGKCVFPQRV